jgi:5-methylcytosine-specific restriction endonuclease McrA
MNAAVLVLDVGMQVLRVEPWQKAICDVFLGKVEVIEYSKDRTIQGANRTWPLPSVVRTLKRFKRERIKVKFSRLNVYTRDDFRCQYDGQRYPTEELTYDHVNPRARGGKTTWENIVTACVECNKRKADKTLEQSGMRLLKQPKKPAFLPVVSVKMDTRNVPEEWKPYWTAVLDL